MDKKAEYMNFPITILQGAFKDIREKVDSIMSYATYKHSLGLEFGGESQRMKEAAKFLVSHSAISKGQCKRQRKFMIQSRKALLLQV